ncbi:hypothetical protein SG34_021640 [Thalassomonas viridans]|uniref:Uncharacterized protein n=1 Tax=Thalassomonas viridans TaxID=137584 RepID=A0AAE9Z0U1_9GAMM|nr:hypothetical protein [Thalassomonas viridans]WDE03949.1 hypothetical protein SG34_021640 [Thalassomonas viridans]
MTLTETYKKLLCRMTGYYCQGTLYRLSYGAGGISFLAAEKDGPAPLILVAAREYYQEQLKSYPVEEKKAIDGLLRLEYGEHSVKYHIADISNGSSHVNIWQFSPDLPKAKLILPESFLLHLGLDHQEVLISESASECLFVAKANKAVVSSLSGALINDVERFCTSAGLALPQQSYQIEQAQLPERLLSGLAACHLNKLLLFVTNLSVRDNTSLIKACIAPVLLTGSLYLLISSLWLLWQNHELQQQVEHQQEEVMQAVALRDDFSRDQQQLELLSDFLVTKSSKSLAWLIVADIYNRADITALRYTNGRFILLGKAPKATDFLAKLSENPLVNNAKFDLPVRKTKKSDHFTISFILKDRLVSAGDKDATSH